MSRSTKRKRRGTRAGPASTKSNGIRGPGRGTRARNLKIAERLREASDLIQSQDGGAFRVNAYRKAADAVVALDRDLGEIAAGGVEALQAIPGVGPSIAGAIAEMLRTGRWGFLERLRGGSDPERVFRMIPGVGPKLARLLHENLHVDTLEGLEAAAAEGRLAEVPGLGRRRISILRGALAEILSRVRPRTDVPHREPGVDLLLDVDVEYRAKSQAGALQRIAPKRLNPKGEAWLPVLHTRRGPWHFTALYSNTARAHELERTHDWVVIYFHSDRDGEAQRTVVTESQGALKGRRVVRGREQDCLEFYGRQPDSY